MKRATPETALAGLTLSGLAAVLVAPVLLGGPLYYRDLSQNLLPVRLLGAALRRAGESLTWNPYLAGGVPLAANPNSLLLHPAWMLDRIVEPVRAIPLTIALHMLLAAGFLFALLLRRGASGPAAASGAAVFAFSGPFLSLGNLPNLLTAAAWIPPALYFLDRARCGRRWSFLPAVACGGASLMAADPASAAALAGGAVLACSASGTGRLTARAAGRTARTALAFFLLSVLAAGVQLVPAWRMIALSERGAGFEAAEAVKWSLHPGRLPELAVAGWLGDPTTFAPGRYWGAAWLETGLPFLLSITLGVPALALAVTGAATRRGWGADRIVGSVLAAGGLLFALGRHVPGYAAAATALPVASSFRYPEKMLLPCVLGVSVLVARGVDRLGVRGETPGWGNRVFGGFLALSGVALAGAALGGGPGGEGLVAALLGRAVSEPALERLSGAMPIPAAFLFVTGGALLLAGRLAGTAAARLMPAGLVFAALAAGAIVPSEGRLPYGLRANPNAPAGFLEGDPAEVALGGDGPDRMLWKTYRGKRPEGFAFRRPGDSMAWGFEWDRITLSRSWPAAYGDPTVFDRPTDRTIPASVARAAQRVDSGGLEERMRLWSIAAVRFVTSYEPLDHEDLLLVGRLEGLSRPALSRYENLAALPRVRLVSGAVTAGSAEGALRSTLSGGLDPSRMVVVEPRSDRLPDEEVPPPTSGEPEGAVEPATGRVELTSDSATRLVMRAVTPRPAWLVIADSHDPDWTARIGSEERAVHRAYGFLRAVALPAGESEVVMEYKPRSYTLGWIAFVAAVSGALVVSVRLKSPGEAGA